MVADPPKGPRTIQTELNRQALVEMSKRLTELEQKMVNLESETEDLRYFSEGSLETAKRLQRIVKSLVSNRKSMESQGKSDNAD